MLAIFIDLVSAVALCLGLQALFAPHGAWILLEIFAVLFLYSLLILTPMRGTLGQYLSGIRRVFPEGKKQSWIVIVLLALVSTVFLTSGPLNSVMPSERYRPVRTGGVAVFVGILIMLYIIVTFIFFRVPIG